MLCIGFYVSFCYRFQVTGYRLQVWLRRSSLRYDSGFRLFKFVAFEIALFEIIGKTSYLSA